MGYSNNNGFGNRVYPGAPVADKTYHYWWWLMAVIQIEKTTIVTWLLRIFLLVIGIVLIYQLLRKIIGGSWELQLLVALIVANFGYSFYLGNKTSEQKGWLNQFEKRFENLEQSTKNGFQELKALLPKKRPA